MSRGVALSLVALAILLVAVTCLSTGHYMLALPIGAAAFVFQLLIANRFP